MNGVTSTLIIWPTKYINEESPRLMKGYGMTSFSTLSKDLGIPEKKNDPGPSCNV